MCEFSSAIPIISLFIAALSLGALAFSGVRYALDRSRQLRQQRFENYHNLLSDLVEGRRGQTVPRLDSQIAVVYEMRNYREYREVSIRILEGLKSRWFNDPNCARLITEIDYTLEKLRKKRLLEK